MKQINLGLPLEYRQKPEYFDAHNVSKETEAKNSVIEKLLKNHDVKTVLHMTCGTGSQVFFLAKRGYKVTGADFSPALLEIAQEKAKSANTDVEFIDGDMRELKVGQFDAVITIYSLPYVKTYVSPCFKSAKQSLLKIFNNYSPKTSTTQ